MTPPETQAETDFASRLAPIEAALANPPVGAPNLPVQLPYYVRNAHAADQRAKQFEARQAEYRLHSEKARRGDPRIMQAGKSASDARKERDRWTQQAEDVFAQWQKSLPGTPPLPAAPVLPHVSEIPVVRKRR